MNRKGKISRKTKETSISVDLNIDGKGKYKIDTGIGFLDHMLEQLSKHSLIDINLKVTLIEHEGSKTDISETNSRELYYSPVQQVIHHASAGCGIATGDLMGSGTVSGTKQGSFGCMLELSWGGKKEILLNSGKKRTFLEDNDTVVLNGIAKESEFTIGFGSCSGKIIK